MQRSTTRQENHQSRNIFRMTNTSIGRLRRQRLDSTSQLHQPIGHLGRIEAWSNCIGKNVSRAQFHGQSLCQTDGCCFGGGVGICAMRADGADADAGYGGGDDDSRGVFKCSSLFKERSESVTVLVLYHILLK